jgi:hypothetical protein
MILNLLGSLRSSSELSSEFQLPERIGSIKKPLRNPLNPLLIPACARQKGEFKERLLYFDVNITTKKVKEKSPWNYLTK